MRRYLVRGGYNPLKAPSTNQILLHDLFGTNSGNVLYLMGVLRSVWANDVDIDVDEYRCEQGKYNDSDITRINNTYDGYLIPLADAFRESFVKSLNRMSDFIDKLTIPVHVISVGIRAEYEPKFVNNPFLDNTVKRFIKAVLNHSPIVGIRGTITGEYLKRLGFIPEKDYTVIGCPSLYMFGDRLSRRDVKFDMYSSISICFRSSLEEINGNLYDIVKNLNDWHVVVQNLDELRCMRLGIGTDKKKKPFFYTDPNNNVYTQDHIKGFVCAGDWIRYMRRKDFSFGGLFHGSVAGILGGATTIVIPSDARMREMVEFHSLPSIPAKEWDGFSEIEEILERVDLDCHLKCQKDTFNNYCRFLNKIGVPSVWDLDEEPKDELMLLSRPLDNYLTKDSKEIANIWTDYYTRSMRNWEKKCKKY